jgi:hypothetical protein
LAGSKRLRIALVNSRTAARYEATAAKPAQGKWAPVSLDFRIPSARGRDRLVDEIHIIADKGAELSIDDLLFYVPGP